MEEMLLKKENACSQGSVIYSSYSWGAQYEYDTK